MLDALRSQAAADADLASADRAVAFAQVDLFRALGGGWTSDDAVDQSAGNPQQ